MKGKQMKRFLACMLAAVMVTASPVSTLAADKAVDPKASNLKVVDTESEEEQQGESLGTERVADPAKLIPGGQEGVMTTDDICNELPSDAVDGKAENVKNKGITFEKTDEKVEANLKKSGAKKLEGIGEEEGKVRVIILMSDKSILEKDSKAKMNWINRIRINQMEAKQNSIMGKIEDKVLDGEELEVRYQYTWALNGVATEVDADKISEIEEIPGVEKVIRTSVYSVSDEEPEAISPLTIGDGEMIGREDTWADGYTGKGMRISIIDTGLDGDHQSFQALSEDKLTDTSATVDTVDQVVGDLNASSLYSDLTAQKVYRSTKVPYAFNYVDENLQYTHDGDSQGDHGTHVAGIAAANKLESTESGAIPSVGVAPDAQLYVMKVFGANGGAYTDDLLAAVEDSLILGADVINMSLGSPAGFTSEGELLDAVYGRVSESNTVLAIAAGNSGTFGEGNQWGTGQNLISNPDNSTVSSPATFVNATSVASVDNARVMSNYVEVAGKRLGYSDGSNGNNAAMATLAGKEYSYVMIDNFGQAAEDFAAAAGKIAVVQRGVTAFTAKCSLAEQAGAIACLIYNNTSGTISMDMSNGEATIPCASITMAAGEYLASALAEDPDAVLTVSDTPALIQSETAYRMSSFSSWGISPDLSLEPDVTAPGGDIYSTMDKGTYGLMSGTSMASPNMAGVSALVSEYVRKNFPKMSASEQHVFINSLIMSTATPLMYDDEVPFSPRSQGAGLVNAYAAVKTDAYLSVDGKDVPKAELKDDPEKTGEYEYTFHVNNFGDTDGYYALNTNAQSEGITYYDGFNRGFMSGTPVALSADTAEDSAQMILTYDYDGDGACTEKDVEVLQQKVGAADGADAFRYDLNGDDACTQEDVQAYQDALKGTKKAVDLSEKVLYVKAGTNADVTVKVSLTEEDRTYLDAFDNGIYVEGFTELTAKNAGCMDLSLPYLAFYGDWTQAPVIDSGYYWEDEDTMEANQYYNILFTNFGSDQNGWLPGVNPYVNEDFEVKNASLSPNNDGFGDYINEMYVSLLRNAKKLKVTYSDAETGNVYFETEVEDVPKSYLVSSYGICIPFMYAQYCEEYRLTDADGAPLANNTKVVLDIAGELDYNTGDRPANNVSDHWQMGLTIDTEAPVLKDASFATAEEDGQQKKLLTLTFADNVDTAAINILNKSGTAVIAQYAVDDVEPGKDCTMTVDVTGVGNQFTVVLGDYAMNESIWRMYTEDNDPILDTSLLYGYRVADSEIQDDTLYGWLSIDKNTAATQVMSSEYYMDYSLTAAEYVGGYIIAVDANNDLLAIRPGYWDSRKKITSLGIKVRELTFDPSTNTLYGYDSSNYRLVAIDIYTGEVTPVGTSLAPVPAAMACDDNGVLYGIKNNSKGELSIIDKETGKWGETLLNTADTTGLYNPSYAQSMTWDSEEQCLYWAGFYYSYMGRSGRLYQINVTDKTMQSRGKIAGNAEVVGLLKLDNKGYEIPQEELASISMSQSMLTMLPNTEENLEVLTHPWNSDDARVSWKSSNEDVVKVGSYGEVTAVGAGTAVITAVVDENPDLTAECQVKVVDPQAHLNAFVLAGNTLYQQWISFQVDDFENVDVKTEGSPLSFYAGEYYDGYIYAFTPSTEMYKINAETFEAKKISESRGDYLFLDMAFDYSSGYMYGLVSCTSGDDLGAVKLVRVDLMTGDIQEVGYAIDEFYNLACTLAISTDGTIYMTTGSGFLYTYDLETQSMSKVGALGYTPSTFNQTMTYDHDSQELYMSLITTSSMVTLAYVDKESGKALPLGAIDNGSQLTAMYAVPKQVPERPEVPVEAVNLKSEAVSLLNGSSKCVPVEVLPYNATDRSILWTVEDPSIATISDNMITGLKPGRTSATGTMGETTLTFTIDVIQSTGDLFGYVVSDLMTGNGMFWGKFKDNDLSAGEGLAAAESYEVYAGEYYDGKIYAIGPDEDSYVWQFMVFDASTYQMEKVVTGDYPDMRDMAFDYTEGVMYGVGGVRNVEGNNTLYMLDIETGGCYAIAKLNAEMAALACTADGQLCGVSNDGMFYYINKENGEITEVFDTGYQANAYQSMFYDRNTGNLYWAQCSRDAMTWMVNADLLIVNPEMKSVMNLGHIGEAGCMISALHTIPKEPVEITPPAISKILMGTEKKMLAQGDSFTLTAVPYPLSVANENTEIVYTSEDPSVASVDENGVVTAVAAGTTSILAACGDVVGSCVVNVVDSSKKLYVLNSAGWQISPLLEPGNVTDVSLPENAGLSIKSATIHTDGYFYAVDSSENVDEWGTVSDAQNNLWKFTEDGSVVEMISEKPLPQWLELDPEAKNPIIYDIESNGEDLYLLASAELIGDNEIFASTHYYIYKMNLETEETTMIQEISADYVGRPIRFSFMNDSECILYDAYQDYIFKLNLTDGSLAQVAWPQGIFVASDTLGMAYSKELDMIFVATMEDYYTRTMGLYMINPATGKVELVDDAAYSIDMKDILLIEGITPVTGE